MDCNGFEAELEGFISERLGPSECRAAEDHLADCPGCRALLEIAWGKLDPMHASEDGALANAILQRTSGPACGRVRQHLCEYADGALDQAYASLAASHLSHCPTCDALADCLFELKQSLPGLAQLDPGPLLLPEILRATALRHRDRTIAPSRAAKFLSSLLWRPRFSLEAAYAGALLVFILAGNPASSRGNAYSAAWEKARTTPRATWYSAQKALPKDWVGFGTATLERAKQRASHLIGYKQQIPAAFAQLEQKRENWLDSISGLPAWASRALRTAWSDAVGEIRSWLNPRGAH